MFYRVVKSKDGQVWTYDFDDLQDAISWVKQESVLDKHSMVPMDYEYDIVEIGK